ncbi:hypothetical protein Cob_v012956 [Colletotrichum orbiculare MAFF 240422]|uniref:Uncharacterized protein n=1 Tax=Colletotrichum orbiculare (strain 104-T / ATCC 96160 / CBS 514.97 / LARS 414 / MAFF 240422) TaxID=1213857 RepID=N4UMX4_COLOR|nr:hypothetical protein Cob_v012956 [Colletotrichum orbiculare MAFF 240422]
MRFSSIFTLVSSITVTSAVPLSLLAPTTPAPGLTGGDGVLQLANINNQLLRLNANISGLDIGTIQSQAGSLNLFNFVRSTLGKILNPVVGGLSQTGSLHTTYDQAVAQLQALAAKNVNLSQAESAQAEAIIKSITEQYKLLFDNLQAKRPAFDAVSASGISWLVNVLLGLVGGQVPTGTPVGTINSGLGTTLQDVQRLVPVLLQRADPAVRSSLQTALEALGNLISARVTIYG